MSKHERLNHLYTTVSVIVLGFFLLLWGAQWLFPGTVASSMVVILATITGVAMVRPGWNIRPRLTAGYWAVLFGALLGSAVLAAYGLRLFSMTTPNDTLQLNMVMILPGVAAVTCAEELLFRQVLSRWLGARRISGESVVIATSIAFAGAHLGPLFVGGSVAGSFYLLQSLSMLWIGLLLGKLRRATDSRTMSWAGHVGYNVAVLFFLFLIGGP